MQYTSKEELDDLKNRIIFLEETIQQLHQQPPVQNFASFPQFMTQGQYMTPPWRNDMGVQGNSYGQAVIRDPSQYILKEEQPFPKYASNTNYGSVNKKSSEYYLTAYNIC